MESFKGSYNGKHGILYIGDNIAFKTDNAVIFDVIKSDLLSVGVHGKSRIQLVWEDDARREATIRIIDAPALQVESAITA